MPPDKLKAEIDRLCPYPPGTFEEHAAAGTLLEWGAACDLVFRRRIALRIKLLKL